MRGYGSDTMPRKAAEYWWNLLKKPGEKRFVAPQNVAYYVKDLMENKWNSVTWDKVLRDRKERQEQILSAKRKIYKFVKPCYLWVFYNDTFLFCGWWLYVKTLNGDYSINFRKYNEKLIKKVMNEVNVDIIPLDFAMWAEAFEKKHHHEGFGRKKQGLLKCWCVIENNNITDIIFK